MIYVSYHNADLNRISNLISGLGKIYSQLWFDRHRIHLFDDWVQNILNARVNTDAALVFLSSSYVTSSYCLEELEQLQNTTSNIIAIIIEDFELGMIANHADFIELFNINHLPDTNKLVSELQTRIANLGIDLNAAIPSERMSYIHNTIDTLEIKLQQATNKHTNLSVGTKYRDSEIRPRGYLPSFLTQVSYSLTIDTENLVLENLISLIEIQPNNILQGAVGSGKSAIALLVALWATHEYRTQDSKPLPIYLDLSDWERTQSFEDYLSSRWSLNYEWRAWLSKNSAFFIIDADELTINKHPNYLEDIIELCVAPRHHSLFLALPQWNPDFDVDFSFAIITAQVLSDTLIQQLADAFLADDKKALVQMLYKHVGASRIERQVDYVAFLIELLNSGTIDDLRTFPRHLVAHIIWLRWKQYIEPVQLPISFEEFLNALKYLAWSMLETDTPYLMSYRDALNRVGDSAILELSYDLGLLKKVDHWVRFEARLMQIHLAAYFMLADGIYKHLSKAKFNEGQARIPSKWDAVTLATYSIVEPEQQDDIIELIDDIDPFLAVSFAQQDEKLLHKYLCSLISKLIDSRCKNPNSHRALVNTLNTIPFVNETALCLLRLIANASWTMQVMLHDLLMQLPLFVPDAIQKQVHDLDRYFDDSRIELLSKYPTPQWIVYLNFLVQHPDPGVQRNAISLLGDCADVRVLPILFALLKSNSHSIVLDAIAALLNITDDKSHLSRLLQNLPDDCDHPDTISKIFVQMQRELSAALLTILQVGKTKFYRDFYISLSQLSEETVRAVISQHIKIDVEKYEVMQTQVIEGKHAMKLSELIQRRLQQIQDKSTLDRLFEEITRVFVQTREEVPEQSKPTPQLYERTKSVLTPRTSNTDVDSRSGSLSDELLEKLNHQDWLVRYRALQELAGYSSDEMMPYIVNAARDDRDIQVRIGALGILANMPITDNLQSVFLNALEDPDSLVIDAAVECIKKLEHFETSRLISMLKHPNLHTIAAAIESLSVHHNPAAVKPLIEMLNDARKPWLGEEPLGYFAAKTLQLIGTAEALEAVENSDFLNKFDQDNIIPPAIERANNSRKSYTSLQKVQLTLLAIRGDKWELAQKAARYLRELAKSMEGTNNQQVIGTLEDALTDEIWTVRWAVVEALAWVKSPSSIGKIIPLLQDENWMVQVAAIRSLIELDAQEAAPSIAILLESPNSAVSETAAEALGLLKNPIVMEYLQESLGSEDEFVRLSTIQSIYQILEADSTPFLLAMLHDPYNHIRWFAIKHLSTQSTPQAVEVIARLLHDHSGPAWEKQTISDYALKALRNINTPESKLILDEWLQQ